MEAKCIICGSKLEHQQTDMAADIDPRYDGDHVAMIYKFRCPVCGRDYEVCDPMEDERQTLDYWRNAQPTLF